LSKEENHKHQRQKYTVCAAGWLASYKLVGFIITALLRKAGKLLWVRQ
jgi:hypothetical protein